MKTFVFAIISLQIFSFQLFHNSTFAEQGGGVTTVQKWEVVELDFDGPQQVSNPFDVEFGAVFQHPNGDRLRVPGFYNGGSRWTVRFCPETTGRWTYSTYSSSPTLAGQSGEISVSANTRKWQRGPLRVAKRNRTKFEYGDGTSCLVMAFEADWLFALDAENANDIPRTRELTEHIQNNGFNQVVMNVFAYDAPWGEKEKIQAENNFAKPTVFPFGGTNSNPDFSTLNVTFFQRLDRVVELLNQKQIAAHLMIYVWNKDVNWPKPKSKADNLYFDYVVRRYQAYPNLIWDISKEALDYGRDDMGYITERIERLRELDAHRRLVTVHDYKYCQAFPDKVDFISIQEWQPYLYQRMIEVAKNHPTKPVFNIEHGGYEKTMHSIFDGAYTNPETCLDRTYQCLFAGTYPTYYWQNSSWYNVITNPFQLPAEQQPHFRYYKYIASLFEEIDFNGLVPSQETFSPPMLSNGKDTYLFYLPENRKQISGRLADLNNQNVRVRWFDPLTGKFVNDQKIQFNEDAWLWMNRPKEITGASAIAILTIEK